MTRKSAQQKSKLMPHEIKNFKRPKTRAEKRKEQRDLKKGGDQNEKSV